MSKKTGAQSGKQTQKPTEKAEEKKNAAAATTEQKVEEKVEEKKEPAKETAAPAKDEKVEAPVADQEEAKAEVKEEESATQILIVGGSESWRKDISEYVSTMGGLAALDDVIIDRQQRDFFSAVRRAGSGENGSKNLKEIFDVVAEHIEGCFSANRFGRRLQENTLLNPGTSIAYCKLAAFLIEAGKGNRKDLADNADFDSIQKNLGTGSEAFVTALKKSVGA